MRFLPLLFLFCFNYFSPRIIKADNQFSHVDKHVKDVSQKMIYHPDLLVKALVEPFDKDEEKVRAIFAWIAQNIEYNYVAYKNNVELVQNTNEVLISGKAMCYGFSLLFQEFCEKAGLKCEILEGYAKGLEYEKDQKFEKPNHAWNAVLLNDKWYLMDVTWAAGTPKELMNNKRVIDLDRYFMTPQDEFIKDHLPQDPTWQLLDKKQTLGEFEEGDKIAGANQIINQYHPNDYTQLGIYEKDIEQLKRSRMFNPDYLPFTELLSFAYIYKANALTDELKDFKLNELYNYSDQLEKEFQTYMDSAWELIDPIPLIRIQKSKRIIEDEINYQKGVFYYEIASEIYIRSYNNKLSMTVTKKKVAPYFSASKAHFENVPSTSIYGKDAREYLAIINKYESRLSKSVPD